MQKQPSPNVVPLRRKYTVYVHGPSRETWSQLRASCLRKLGWENVCNTLWPFIFEWGKNKCWGSIFDIIRYCTRMYIYKLECSEIQVRRRNWEDHTKEKDDGGHRRRKTAKFYSGLVITIAWSRGICLSNNSKTQLIKISLSSLLSV